MHRLSNSRQYGFLATLPDSCALSRPRQCISVGLGMFLLSAKKKVKLCVQHEKRQVKSSSIDQESLRASASSFVRLLVKTFPNFRDIFQKIVTPCRLVLPQSGFSDSVISSRQFCCSIREWEYVIFASFQTLILPLH